MSKALTPCRSNLHEAQSTAHVELKPSEQGNTAKKKGGGVKGQSPSIKYRTYCTLHNSLSFSLCL